MGIYSPGKAFVVYEIKRQVCQEGQETVIADQLGSPPYLADRTIADDDTYTFSQLGADTHSSDGDVHLMACIYSEVKVGRGVVVEL